MVEEVKNIELGKKIKLFLVEKGINQNQVSKFLNISDSLLSDKLNGKVKISTDEFYSILVFLNNKLGIRVEANYFMPLDISTTETSDTN